MLARALLVLACAFSAAPAGAGVMTYTQLSQTRDLEARVSVSHPDGAITQSDSETSNQLGSFFRSMAFDVTGRGIGSGPPPHADVAVGQDLVFGDGAIFGSFGLDLHISGEINNSASGRTRSTSTFSVPQETPFALNGRLRMNVDAPRATGSFTSFFRLTGAGPGGEAETIEAVSANAQGTGFGGTVDEPLLAAGVLRPGWTYTLFVELSGLASADRFFEFGNHIEGQADFSLTLPEPVGLPALAATLGALTVRRPRRP